eukprot:3566723-Rhodomonas_salina.1
MILVLLSASLRELLQELAHLVQDPEWGWPRFPRSILKRSERVYCLLDPVQDLSVVGDGDSRRGYWLRMCNRGGPATCGSFYVQNAVDLHDSARDVCGLHGALWDAEFQHQIVSFSGTLNEILFVRAVEDDHVILAGFYTVHDMIGELLAN